MEDIHVGFYEGIQDSLPLDKEDDISCSSLLKEELNEGEVKKVKKKLKKSLSDNTHHTSIRKDKKKSKDKKEKREKKHRKGSGGEITSSFPPSSSLFSSLPSVSLPSSLLIDGDDNNDNNSDDNSDKEVDKVDKEVQTAEEILEKIEEVIKKEESNVDNSSVYSNQNNNNNNIIKEEEKTIIIIDNNSNNTPNNNNNDDDKSKQDKEENDINNNNKEEINKNSKEDNKEENNNSNNNNNGESGEGGEGGGGGGGKMGLKRKNSFHNLLNKVKKTASTGKIEEGKGRSLTLSNTKSISRSSNSSFIIKRSDSVADHPPSSSHPLPTTSSTIIEIRNRSMTVDGILLPDNSPPFPSPAPLLNSRDMIINEIVSTEIDYVNDLLLTIQVNPPPLLLLFILPF